MKKVVAYVSYGLGGEATDPGEKVLDGRIEKLGVSAPGPYFYYETEKIAAAIRALPAEVQVVIGGASLGANEAPYIAALVAPRPVSLIFGIQNSIYGIKAPVPANVARALYFYTPWWFPITMGLGAYQWSLASGNKRTALVGIATYYPHPGDGVASVQDVVLAEIKKLL